MEPALNIVEVLLETEPVDVEIVETMEVLERPSRNGQCGKEYPFAYEGGSRCCENGFDDPTDLDGIRRNGFLNYDSKGCIGESQPCPLGCLNYQYETYWCYAHHVGLQPPGDLGQNYTTTWQDCVNFAKDLKAGGFVWTKTGLCYAKGGNVILAFGKDNVQRMGLIPCP